MGTVVASYFSKPNILVYKLLTTPPATTSLFFLFPFLPSSLLPSSSTRRRFYPQRSSGQAVVTGVVPSPPWCVPSFLSRIRFRFPLLVDFHRMLLTHALALSANHIVYSRKSPYECVHSVRIGLAKLILVGTRITYQATGNAGLLLLLLSLYSTPYSCHEDLDYSGACLPFSIEELNASVPRRLASIYLYSDFSCTYK